MTFLADYKTMYCRLCRAADDAVSIIEEDAQNAEAAAALLREALLDAEALFLEAFLHCTDTFIAVSRPETADETGICGTDKSVPYKVRSKTQRRTTGLRGRYGFLHCSEPGNQR
jgi:hypothetical protein